MSNSSICTYFALYADMIMHRSVKCVTPGPLESESESLELCLQWVQVDNAAM